MSKGSFLKTVSSGLSFKGQKAVLVDTRKCVACKACTIACKFWNENPREVNKPKTELSPNTWTIIAENELVNEHGKLIYAYAKKQCMHCVEPWCVSVCPTEALYKTEEGPVLYNSSRCIGCKYCVQACPYHVPQFDEEKHIIQKCIFCHDRLKLSLPPACVDTCITGCLQFGSREEIVAKAMEAKNEGYKVYGLREGGGTSWIYIFPKNIEPEYLKFPKIGVETPSTFKLNMLKSIAGVGVAATIISLAGFSAVKFLKRKAEVASKKEKSKEV